MTPFPRILRFVLAVSVASAGPAIDKDPAAAQTVPAAAVSAEQLQQVLSELHAQGQRIKELENELAAEREAAQKAAREAAPATEAAAPNATTQPAETAETASSPVGTAPSGVSPGIAVVPAPSPPEQSPPHEHSMQLPAGGPILKISGFADFNLEFGQDANPLIFPLSVKAPATFQFGQMDLFVSSQLSRTVSFLGEIVFGPGETPAQINVWGLDLERLEVTYKPSRYFNISGGRYH